MYYQFDIVQVQLDPTQGHEQQGTRPCLIISNNRTNSFGNTYVIAIITSTIKEYPHTLIIEPSTRNGLSSQSRIDFLQVRTIDATRIVKQYGTLETKYYQQANQCMKVAFDIQ